MALEYQRECQNCKATSRLYLDKGISLCKKCANMARVRRYRANHPDCRKLEYLKDKSLVLRWELKKKIKKEKEQARNSTPERKAYRTQQMREWRANNRERNRENGRKNYYANRHKMIQKVIDRLARFRCPAWADRDAIARIYKHARALSKSTGIQQHVDHVIPLRGKVVSGLHVENNLQIIPAVANWAKHAIFNCDLS